MPEIAGTNTVLPDQALADVSISIEDGKIVAVGPKSGKVEEFSNSLVLPGFIDLHTHGRLGHDTANIDAELLRKYARTGTTAFLPTYCEATPSEMSAWLKKVQDLKEEDPAGGAEIVGTHLEGPFIDPVNRGGIKDEVCTLPDDEIIESLLSSPMYSYTTISPYVEGAIEVIKKLSEYGIICVAGHSRGEAELLASAVEAGLKGVCHFFNNNTQFSDVFKEDGVRKPTLDEAALLQNELFLEMICDMQHVDPVFIKMALRLKGVGRIAVVTDSISAAGLSEGEYKYHDGRKYKIKNGGVHESETGGRFGSCVIQPIEFANLVETIGVSYQDAARMCALTPAEILGVDSRKGSLEPGKDADLLVLDRDTYEIQVVFAKGVRVEL